MLTLYCNNDNVIYIRGVTRVVDALEPSGEPLYVNGAEITCRVFRTNGYNTANDIVENGTIVYEGGGNSLGNGEYYCIVPHDVQLIAGEQYAVQIVGFLSDKEKFTLMRVFLAKARVS